MDTSANTITTMGIIADEVYNNNQQTIDYFKDEYNLDGSLKEKFISGTNYKVIDHTPADNEGFNALLLEKMDSTGKGSGEYVIAFRGTQETFDIVEDGIIGLNNYSSQFEKAKVWVNQMIENNNIDKSKLTLTGHSLGGILTQAIGATYQIKGYAFNGYGVDRLLTMPSLPINTSLALDLIYGIIHTAIYKIFSAFGMEAPNAQWAQENILNVQYFDNGLINGDPLSNLATNLTSKHLGDFLPIFGTEESAGQGHRMPVLNDAIEHYNNILNSFSSDTSFMDLTDIYTLFGFDRVEKIFTELDIYSKTQLQLNILENINYEDILNSNDKSKLYALINQIPFTISSSSVDLYQNFDISNMSESELNDRGLMYQYIINNTPEEQREYIFMNYETKINLIDNSLKKPAIVFGNDTDDRIYTGAGDDTIILGKGNDYLKKRVA